MANSSRVIRKTYCTICKHLDDEDVPNPRSLDEDDLPLTVRANNQVINRIVNDPLAARAVDQLRQVRRSPRFAQRDNNPIVVNMNESQLNRVRRRSPSAMRAVQALNQVRRSPRLNN